MDGLWNVTDRVGQLEGADAKTLFYAVFRFR